MTWLAAFHATRPEVRRVLFVVHREEILWGSRDVFRRVRPDADLGFFDGTHEGPDAHVLFASIQTLAGHLDTFDPSDFAATWTRTSSTTPRRRLVVGSC